MPLQLPSTDPQPLAPGLYATDAFHRRPLFAVSGQVVRSWNEAHALHGPARLEDVNPVYVAALISGNHNAEAAPYTRIRRLPRAHHVHVGGDGTVQTSAYDPLADGAGPMDPETLHAFLRQGLLDHISQALEGHNGPVACEHSSGLDSNAVLGALRHGLGVPAERIHTWSNENGGERQPLQVFRPFHALLPEQCISSDILKEEGRPDQNQLNAQQLAVFGAPAQIGGLPWPLQLFQQRGCSVVFSGFGGDQALSHNAANVPSDLVALGRWRALIQWVGGSRRQALKTGAGRVLALGWRPWAVRKVLERTKDFCRSDLLMEALTDEGRRWLGAHLQDPYPWEIDGYLRQHVSIRRRVLADWVAVRAEEETRLAAAHGMAKAFPLLDERSIATLLHQDPALFGEGAGRGRLLHRKAFSSFLPPMLRANPTKDRDPEGGLEQWRSELAQSCQGELRASLERSQGWHPWIGRIWKLDAVQRRLDVVAEDDEGSLQDVMGAHGSLQALISLNSWAVSAE